MTRDVKVSGGSYLARSRLRHEQSTAAQLQPICSNRTGWLARSRGGTVQLYQSWSVSRGSYISLTIAESRVMQFGTYLTIRRQMQRRHVPPILCGDIRTMIDQ